MYHYQGCGLPNVFLQNGYELVETPYGQGVTIHDLDFLDHPERTAREIRRDYPALVAEHAQRADRVIVVSRHTAGEVERRLGVSSAKISKGSQPGIQDFSTLGSLIAAQTTSRLAGSRCSPLTSIP